MLLVVADTSPLNYLVLIGEIELLPKLFERILAPAQVIDELRHPRAPDVLRKWAAAPPTWLQVKLALLRGPELSRLHAGESAAIALARMESANLLLMDDRPGRAFAQRSGLNTIGTIGVLDLAARRQLVDIHAAMSRLAQTNFRRAPGLIEGILSEYPQNTE